MLPFPPKGSSAFGTHPMQHPVKVKEEQVEADVYIDPWIGWRCWAIEENNGDIFLKSITYSSTWVPEQHMEAQCLNIGGDQKTWDDEHHSPDADCGCGIYSVTTEAYAKMWLNQYWMSLYQNSASFRCFGEVKLWGSVIRFTKGFLAQYAYPQTIIVPHDAPKAFPLSPQECVQELKKRYRGVKVKLL